MCMFACVGAKHAQGQSVGNDPWHIFIKFIALWKGLAKDKTPTSFL